MSFSASPSFDGEDYDYDDTKNTNTDTDTKPKKQRKSVAGRQLMRWSPDMDQLVLLWVDHICAKDGIAIPWDKIAKAIKPYMSGEAIKQHLAKVRSYRVQFDLPVPNKLDKNVRRKATQAANAGLVATGKGANAAKIKNEDGDDEEEKPKKGASLLFLTPEKKTKSVKKAAGEDTTPKAPTTGRGRGGHKKATTEGGDCDDDANKGFTFPPKSTGKRGRSNKDTVKDEDEDSELSPPKRQKLVTLRTQRQVNYNEQPDSGDDVFESKQGQACDQGYEDYDPAQMAIKHESSSQDSANYEHQQPSPEPYFSFPNDQASYQAFMGSSGPNHTGGNGLYDGEANTYYNSIYNTHPDNVNYNANAHPGNTDPNNFGQLNTGMSAYSDMPITTSPTTYTGNPMFPDLDNSTMPAMNAFSMNTGQYAGMPNHDYSISSSFGSSIQGSQGDQAKQTIEQFNPNPFDPTQSSMMPLGLPTEGTDLEHGDFLDGGDFPGMHDVLF